MNGNRSGCDICKDHYALTWIDGVCKKCRPKPPTTEQLLTLSFRKLKSMNSQITFFTILVIINLIGILLLLFGIVEL